MMDQSTQAEPNTDKLAQNAHSEIRYVARQPILNLHGRVHGYELLFRYGQEHSFSGDRKQATRTILDDTLNFGFERLTGGLPAFINCSAESILEQLVEVLPPATTVIEINGAADFSPALLAACRRLKSIGYYLALDNFIWEQRLEPLAEIADYIKVDFCNSTPDQRREVRSRFQKSSTCLIAVKVESESIQAQARKEGFSFFQGYYFCQPELLSHAKIPANRLIHVQILHHLYRVPLDLPELCKLVKFDAALTYRLLRLVNSPGFAIRQQICNIEMAIVLVGEATFRRIASLAILSELNSGKPPEVLRMTLMRARFCELAAPLCGLQPDEQYLLGMLSLLPAMLRMPMDTLVAQMPMRHEIHQALLGTNNAERGLLQWLEAYERGAWELCDTLAQNAHLHQQQLVHFYNEAMAWNSSEPDSA